MLGNGRLCPPRLLYRKIDNRRFTSVLSMPANCPVREDIVVSETSIASLMVDVPWWITIFEPSLMPLKFFLLLQYERNLRYQLFRFGQL